MLDNIRPKKNLINTPNAILPAVFTGIIAMLLLSGCSAKINPEPIFVLAKYDANSDGQFIEDFPGNEGASVYSISIQNDKAIIKRYTDPNEYVPEQIALSPDRTHLAFATKILEEEQLGSQIAIIDVAETGEITAVPYEAGKVLALYWSRSGENLAVIAINSAGMDEVIIVDPNTGEIMRTLPIETFMANEIQDYSPLVSPDIEKRLWPKPVEGGLLLRETSAMATPAPDATPLFQSPFLFLGWSPDSETLLLLDAYSTDLSQFNPLPEPHGAIYTAKSDGSALTPRTAGGGASSASVWSPDGSQIAYLTLLEDLDNDGTAETRLVRPALYFLSEDGTAERVILGEQYELAWVLDW